MADPGGDTGDSAVAIQVAEIPAVIDYFKKLVPVLLEDSGTVTAEFQAALSKTTSLEAINKFVSDPATKCLIIGKTVIKEDDEDEPADKVQYVFQADIIYTNSRQSSIAIIKKGAIIEADKAIQNQVRIIDLGSGSPYESLHSVISNAVSPFFKSYVRKTGKIDRDGDKMVPTVEKNIIELEMGLLHLQQNIDIPEINLTIHPAILAVINNAKEEARTPKASDFDEKVEDSTFLNQLQSGVSRWVREIQKVTKLDRDPASGTALQEITFWLNLERALLRIQEKRESIEIQLTLDVLKNGKRFLATVSFDSDTGLQNCLQSVNDYNILMKDFPLNDLLSATELQKISRSLFAIFNHLRKIRHTKYPFQRCLMLIDAISRDLSNQLLKVLSFRRPMHISYEEFERIIIAAFEVFATWDDEFDKLQQLLREIGKKKRDESLKMAWRLSPAHKKLQSRLDQMKKFRKQHEQLRIVIVRVLKPVSSQRQQHTGVSEDASAEMLTAADVNAIEEVNVAYESVKEVDGLDVSKEGTDLWEAAIKRYDERIDRVETRITARLRDQLGTAKNANEMFRIFSRFNALFVRCHIRGAIREYQTQLIARVKDDIDHLHNRFKIGYPQSKASKISRTHDIAPISGSIMWAQHISQQLTFLMKRVEDVLGKGWENHVEGQKLKGDSDSFRKKLSTQEVYDDWVQKTQQKQLTVSGRIFYIENLRSRTGRGNVLKLRVNFSPDIIQIYKEVRNLKWLGFRVPLGIMNKAHQANQLYPLAINLIEANKTFERTNEKIKDKDSTGLLLAGLEKEIQGFITDGASLSWESYKLDPYVQRLSIAITQYEDKVDDLLINIDKIYVQVNLLENCAFDSPVFRDILSRIQNTVDELNLHSYSNLPQWVKKLDEQVEKRLAVRLQAGIRAWEDALIMDVAKKLFKDDDEEETVAPGGDPQIDLPFYEFRLKNQVIYFHPGVCCVTNDLLASLSAWEANIVDLPRIQSQRYQVGIEKDNMDATYSSVSKKMPDGIAVLSSVFSVISKLMIQIDNYVGKWIFFQALWDLTPQIVEQTCGNDMNKWMQLLNEIKNSRSTFDTAETTKLFGAVKIDFGKVQPKVSLKYDSIHKELLSRFGSLLSESMQDFYSNVSKSRTDLEAQSIDTASTSEAVGFITYVQTVKRKMKNWDAQVSSFTEGQKVLEKQRYQFPPSWLYMDNLSGEWGAFNDILKRKDSSIQGQVGQLQMKIVEEDKQVEERTLDILQEWDKNRPVGGELRPEDASTQLAIFETKFNRLKEDRDNLAKAKEALDLQEPGQANANEERLKVALEEMTDLKGVWVELSGVWEKVNEMKDQPWLSINPRKLRQQLDAQLNQLKSMPSKLRQYPSFEHVQNRLRGFTKANGLITELKSDSLKERHWKQLQRKLGVSWVSSELTLGNVWDVDLVKNEAIVKDILSIAQGEMALEEFMKQVRDCWMTYELELMNYQNKCKIIRGWDDLFTKVKEHINSVAAMKLSPYYKVFEEEALAWEEKLNRINAIFDVWIDVQRRWVYLVGIFTGSADIQHLLPVETQRFHSISSEFLTLMKKVAKKPLVLDVLNIQGVQRQMERLADLLAKIQKALGEYLERERSSFPRFYFVGDEDLLEMIGHQQNVEKIQKHCGKMFAGINQFVTTEDGSIILGIASKQGEEVIYKTPVDLPKRKINEWLTMVEQEMRLTLATLLANAVEEVANFQKGEIDASEYIVWVDKYQAQLVTLATQIAWSENVEKALKEMESSKSKTPLEEVLKWTETTLTVLADNVLLDQPLLRRKKLEHLITEMVHKRDVTRRLLDHNVCSASSFDWLSQMRFYFNPKESEVLKQLSIHMSNACFNYGFEYLGVQDKLVQTPLTDRCYLTMTQALEGKFGGSPFGPAGTGKTESVKALGNQLGRFVLVFNCDETFDSMAMGRIFVGLCQVGAWGCFDEFNRLEERMLSACSQQIQAIQECLKQQVVSKKKDLTVDIIGKPVIVNSDMAIFITMNPGYAGRSNLPDNLKKLFRSLAMTKPNRQLIAQVMLYSQGFRNAEMLSTKVVPFFILCDEQLSCQSHYDFGLRSLKSVLVTAGNLKRDRIQKIRAGMIERGELPDENVIAEGLPEQEILIQSICQTVVPKLVAEDIPLLFSLLSDVFPGIDYKPPDIDRLRLEVQKICRDSYLSCSAEEGEMGYMWQEKVMQLYSISTIHHGLMMVGPSGSGKSTAWRVLLKALERVEGVEGVAHVLDPKAISKDDLYGTLDPNTREWTDGLFTSILRRIVDNVRGELSKRQWIIFDGDVDPEWVENLNSVLDDNKLLTLPNGERLSIPPNLRIMFEVQDLKYATLATVSRCGMIWFSEHVVTLDMNFDNYLSKLSNVPIDEGDDDSVSFGKRKKQTGDEILSPALQVQKDISLILQPYFTLDGLIAKCLDKAEKLDHVMDFSFARSLGSLYTLINQMARNIIKYNSDHPDFPIQADQLERYISKAMIYNLIWCLTGDGKLSAKQSLCEYIASITTIPLPPSSAGIIIDFEVTIQGEWVPWQSKVPILEVETHKVGSPDVVVPTLDTVRHESLLYTWLAEHKPLILCGPPGSGKTMTLFKALRSLPDMEVVGLNFSSATTPELLLKTFDHYCEYVKTPNGLVLRPIQIGKWIVVFCDEINLPDMDKYGTMRIISFIRQMVELGGFFRTKDMAWVTLDRIQFVGACNPPTDPGRKPLSERFLRHVPIVYVDCPGPPSLKQIYGTFNRALLRMVPNLKPYAQPLTDAMVDFFTKTQERFTADIQPHYVYSPREMTRWVRGINEALKSLDNLNCEGLVRIWAHEALRLFQDRLVFDEERKWTDDTIDEVAMKHFPSIDRVEALKRPILFSNWLSKDYIPVEREELREFVKARLKVFYEEELDVPLVLFNEVLDHVLRIDRVFRQVQGHLLLIGVSGAGKTTLSRFVAWMNGLSVVQIKVHNRYSMEDFDEDLRSVLRRAGCKKEKICFVLDEGNVLDSSFLERINTLLANGEVPGLFEGDEQTTLMTQCKEGSQRDGLMLASNEELYKWFTVQIMKNLHVVFTMNPSADGLKDRAATSPALFNRCVLNWFGDWSTHAYYEVGKEFTAKIDLDKDLWKPPAFAPVSYDEISSAVTYRDAVNTSFVFVHNTLHQANEKLVKRGGRVAAITPRHFLDFINHYVALYSEKRSELEEQQLHLNIGLQKIRETVLQVQELQKSLTKKSKILAEKESAANSKLKQMVKDQQEAEQNKTESQQIQKELIEQTKFINERTHKLTKELSEVEPAVEDAKNAVKSIKKQHLDELRRLPNPPALVKIAMESVCLMIGEPTTDWKTIRQLTMKDTFIPSIVNFDTDKMVTDDLRDKMKDKYMSNPDFTFEKVNRASQACGPLVKWAIAQIKYSDMLNQVDPMRQELKGYEDAANANKRRVIEMNTTIKELESSIAQYKDEYASLISEAQAIKNDASLVEAKVNRSVALLSSLSSERVRWEASSVTFKTQMQTIVGDVLLTSAFMAYGGYFDQNMRNMLFLTWSDHLGEWGIDYRPDLSRVEYLSTADDRLSWQANLLPADDLYTENAIMLKRYNRYPLIIDPSGQATDFITNEYKNRKMMKTSFLDDSFRKNLESALRFGSPLLVQDVETYDPILNPVLNKEVKRTGGRVLITIGDQDIDLSPAFVMFMSTRDPTAEFPPDLCSRVTFVNFTITRSSLQSQCLNTVLKAERPDIDEKRSDLLKLQGEFKLKLRQLEKSLLKALNDCKGNILDDDNIIATLETLKKEAAQVQRKVDETDQIMAEVETTLQQYMPLSQACSSIYFTLESLNQVHFLYQYSLKFFLDVFHAVLYGNKKLQNVTDSAQRLSIITKDLFNLTFDRVSKGMIHKDRICLAMLLARIQMKQAAVSESTYDLEFQAYLRGFDKVLSQVNIPPIPGLNKDQLSKVAQLSKVPALKGFGQWIKAYKEEFCEWLKYESPEKSVPECWDESKAPGVIGKLFIKLLLIQAFHPDRVLSATTTLVNAVMGQDFLNETQLDLSNIVANEVKPGTPILMCGEIGYDASGRVDDLATQECKQLSSIAIGSAEGYIQAEKAINSAAKSGTWVVVKNVHLAPQWLVSLEKKLHNLTPHLQFRLFLTMEISPKIPVSVLRLGRVFTFEAPPGIKSNLLRTFGDIPNSRISKPPNERSRLYFLLAWFHAIIQERLHYAPLGWSKCYEFNDSDLRCGCDTLDTWLDSVAKGRGNVSPETIPWDALRTLLGQSIYGGKIDNSFDQRLLVAFLMKVFTPASFEADFVLVRDIDGVKGRNITMPDGIRREQFVEWVNRLPDTQTPSWLGLPNSAEKVLLATQAQDLTKKLQIMTVALEDDFDARAKGDRKISPAHKDVKPVWMTQLASVSKEWKQILPKTITGMRRTVDNIKDPLFRFFERECKTCCLLLKEVRHDIDEVIEVCDSGRKQTNYLRILVQDLAKGIIPKSWSRYKVSAGISVSVWVIDFAERARQIHRIAEAACKGGFVAIRTERVWLGGLFTPEAYITATRQYVAQSNQWSLEELDLQVRVSNHDGEDLKMDDCSFPIVGLKLVGAECLSNTLKLCKSIQTDLPVVEFSWVREKKPLTDTVVTLPVYLNHTRENLLFTLDFESTGEGSGKDHSFYERGVAILTSGGLSG